ncbi:MAG: DUF808 domain-containing protein [Bacteriovoracaceae bacterium]|nr:DUF808 domain-containing protein [Bacteriovoracaceae bacterium]
MAGTSLLTLIDDIATILDDVAVLSKVAAKKTSGVLGDDLALNAEQVTGVSADREIPVVMAVAKGSLINKAILVPSALLISTIAPFLISPLLMLGGGFLCFEGFEKIFEKLFHKKDHQPDLKKLTHPELPLDEMEKTKIKGAVTTDFILSAEIIVITLGGLASVNFTTRLMVLVSISLIMTIGVYGLVALIVKLDDFGLYLQKKNGFRQILGRCLLVFAPLFMKGLGIAGTIAMFLVGGGILAHALPFLHHYQQTLTGVMPTLFEGFVGIVAGGLVLVVVTLAKKILKK